MNRSVRTESWEWSELPTSIASTKYRHRSDRSTPYQPPSRPTTYDLVDSPTNAPQARRDGKTGRAERVPAAGDRSLSCVNRRTTYTKSSTTLRTQKPAQPRYWFCSPFFFVLCVFFFVFQIKQPPTKPCVVFCSICVLLHI